MSAETAPGLGAAGMGAGVAVVKGVVTGAAVVDVVEDVVAATVVVVFATVGSALDTAGDAGGVTAGALLLVLPSLPLPPQALSSEVNKNSAALLRRLPTKLMMTPLVLAGDEPVAGGD